MKKIAILCVSSLIVAGVFTDLSAQGRKRKKQEQAAARAKDTVPAAPKLSAWERLLKDPQRLSKGLMNLYQVKGKLYLEVPLKLMERDMLLASTISAVSDNYAGVVGSKPKAPLLVNFSHVDSSILLRNVVKNTVAPGQDGNIRAALDKNSIGAIMKIFPVAAYNKDKSAAVIDVTDFFLSDNKELSPFGGFSLYAAMGLQGTQMFRRDRSFIGDIKSFDDNIIIRSHLSYDHSLTRQRVTLAKDEPFTAEMTRTLLLLPETPVRPRMADSRIGIFVTMKNQLTNAVQRTEDVYFANRFRLEPKDVQAWKRGELSEPVKPIVFYVDNDFPESWKKPVKAAIEAWNTTFERIGFKRAVLAKDYPADSSFDPDNLKYNCVRYAPMPIANAMGPSWVDPRSGEIINASVYVFHDIMKLLNHWMLIQTGAVDTAVRSIRLPESLKEEGIKYVVRHEIGHCLGFMHNMGASSSIPVDSLRSPSFTRQYGTTHSIMDYARFNYVAQPGDLQRGVKLAPPLFGVYDYYLVKWNYTWFDDNVSPEEEKKQLAAMIAEKAGDVRYRYGAQQAFAFDPSSQTEDLGDDAMKASALGIKNLKLILKNLNNWIGKEDKDYSSRQELWQGIISQYVRYINHVYPNIGGFYLYEKYVGDPGPLHEPVPRKKQEQALQFLLREMQSLDWVEEKDIIQNMTLTGTPATALRNSLVDALLQLPVRVHLSSLKSEERDPYTPREVMQTIYAAVWDKTIKNKVPGKPDRDMQKSWIQSVLKNSRLGEPTAGGAVAFSNAISTGISLHGLLKEETGLACQHYGYDLSHDPISAFGGRKVNFSLTPALESLNFSYLLKVRTLLQNAVTKSADNETMMHYKLLLHQVDKALK